MSREGKNNKNGSVFCLNSLENASKNNKMSMQGDQ